MKTDEDMRWEIIRTLDEGTPDGHSHYDVEGILNACHAAMIDSTDSWNLDLLGASEFWTIVESCDARRLVRPVTPTAKPTAEELVSTLVRFYAQRRNGRHSVPGSEVLIQAWQLVHGGSEEDANEAVGELLQEIYASAA